MLIYSKYLVKFDILWWGECQIYLVEIQSPRAELTGETGRGIHDKLT